MTEKTEIKYDASLMDRRTFEELINPKRAKWLLTIPDREIKKLFWDKEEQGEDGDRWDWKTYIKGIRTYLRETLLDISPEGLLEYERKYKYAAGRKYGRLYTRRFSIQSLQARIRNFLITNDDNKPYYTDIDIENCHYSILLGLVDNYNAIVNDESRLECRTLKEYVNKRKEMFEKHKFTKKEALILLNSDRITTTKKNKDACYVGNNRFLTYLYQEINAIKDAWLSDVNYVKYTVGMDGKRNPKSSFLNRILCDKEAKYLQMVIKLLNEDSVKKYIVPMFDGLLVSCERQSSKGKQLELLLKDINNLTKESFGHSIKWIAKPVIDDADILEEDILDAEENCELYSLKKLDYEKQRCYIKSQTAYQLQYRDSGNCMVWKQVSHTHLKEEGMNKRCINDKGEDSDMFTEWSKDPKRRTYEDIEFVPYSPLELPEDKSHIFNTFGGMGFNYDEKYREQEKDPILKEFLLNTIGDGDELAYEYLYYKMAHILQEPNTNPLVATILSGQEGVGKDSLIYLIRKLIGKDYVVATNKMEDIIPKRGSFNMQLKDKIVVEFNETAGKDGVEYMEQIKDFVTRECNPIRELYKAPYDQKNIIRLFILTNQLNPIQMKDGQRRFVWFKLNGDRKGDKDYWNETYSYFNNKEWIEKIGNELLNVDYGEYFNEKIYPETEVMKQYYKLNRSNTMDFIWYDIIQKAPDGVEQLYIETKNLYDKFRNYCDDNSIPMGYDGRAWSASNFKKELLDIGVGDNTNRRHHNTNKRMFSFDLSKIRNKLVGKYSQSNEEDIIELDGNCYIMED